MSVSEYTYDVSEQFAELEANSRGHYPRILRFYVQHEGAEQGSIVVTGFRLTSDTPTGVFIHTRLATDSKYYGPDVMGTVVGEVESEYLQFYYRRLDSQQDPSNPWRYDILIVE